MNTAGDDWYSVTAIRYALQYWISGRYAAASWFSPVAANLLHHTVELLLKAAIASKSGKVPTGARGHQLVNIVWPRFRSLYPDPALAALEPTIAALDKFEDIRYPEELIEGGGTLQIPFDSAHFGRRVGGAWPAPTEYKIAVNDVDTIVRTLLAAIPVNPEFFGDMLNQEHAAPYHMHLNPSPLKTS